MVKKVLKRTAKQTKQLLGLGVITTTGSLTLGQIGGSGAVLAQQGLGSVARFQPVFGTLVGGGAALGLTKELLPRKKKNKRSIF